MAGWDGRIWAGAKRHTFTLGGFLLFIREKIHRVGPESAQALLDTLEAFGGTPVDLTNEMLLNLDWKTTSNLAVSYLKMSLFEPSATISPRTKRVQVEISLGDWVDATRNNLQVVIAGHGPVTEDKSRASHVRFVSLITKNKDKNICTHTPDETQVDHLSQMAQELLYLPFTLPGYNDVYDDSYEAFFEKVTSLREGWAESVLNPQMQ
ncbi:hypothetical protein Neosp_014879 [[Neocosmospora] mangrovei]